MDLDGFLKRWAFDSDEWQIISDCIQNNGENFYSITGNLFSQVAQDIGDIISAKLRERPIETVERWEIKEYAQAVVQAVVFMLERDHADKFKKSYIRTGMANEIGYRVYVYWILKKLEKAGLDIDSLDYSDVPQELAQEIYNILQSESLTTLFIVLKSAGILNYSANPVNEYEIESEMKILEVDPEALWKRLEAMGAQRVFDGRISDDYFDTPALDLDRNKKKGKRSLRVRSKQTSQGQDSTFYTIKRKIEQVKTEKSDDKNTRKKPRSCYEKEFEIQRPDLFSAVLQDMWFRNSRSKKKPRVAYMIEIFIPETRKVEKVKFDFDTYEGIPPLLEIECESDEAFWYFVRELWLEEHTMLDTGSRGLFDHYGLKPEYDSKYTQSPEGFIIWKS